MNRIVEWIRSKIGCGYVYGATGWTCTEKRLEQQAEQYPDYVDISVCRKWIGKECYDCAQLVKKALAEIGVSIPSGATSQWKADVWKEKGEIDGMPDTLCALYRQDGSIMQHTGWHIGGGVTIDARGSDSGVIMSTVDKYPWTHYAIPKGIEQEEGKGDESMCVLCEMMVGLNSGHLNIRDEPSTKGRDLGDIPNGAIVEVLVEDTDGWTFVRYNGRCGYVASRYLKRIEEDDVAQAVEAVIEIKDDAGNVFRPEGGFTVRIVDVLKSVD